MSGERNKATENYSDERTQQCKIDEDSHGIPMVTNCNSNVSTSRYPIDTQSKLLGLSLKITGFNISNTA